MAELVDALDLGSSAARRVGSSPTWRTIFRFSPCCLFDVFVLPKRVSPAGPASANVLVFRTVLVLHIVLVFRIVVLAAVGFPWVEPDLM